ncbi:transcriptional regulator [Microbacterium sp. Marseille-Q6965]|uniref:helix-turn-helix transcriptional regulator n=1 Tax=Microbacterium sp. Marseille-Q6965 TaxID=2965072 RepID=UPI0021B73FCC|nr:PAS domain-containing protein [Microbacterium sp. Marseille-Q6965]
MTDTATRPGADVNRSLQDERERLIRVFSDLVQPLGQSLPSSIEVVLHDLARLPNSIVAVHGDVTGRRVGDPATDLLLQKVAAGDFAHAVGYSTRLPDGRCLRSTTMILRDSTGTPVAALCLNSDVSVWQSLGRIAADMGAAVADGVAEALADALPSAAVAVPEEVFPRDVDELASHLIHQAIAEQNVPVDLMRKEHKIAVVRALRERGMFMLRDAVEMIAASLGVTRFTIYNYLNELEDEEAPVDTDSSPKRKRASR